MEQRSWPSRAGLPFEVNLWACDKQDPGKSFCLQKGPSSTVFGEMQGSKKKAFKIVKGKTNWISEVALQRLGLLHLEGKERENRFPTVL